MTLLIFGLMLFLGIHSVQIINPRIRARTIEKGGSLGAWMWPYTAIAATGLLCIIFGYGLARPQASLLYSPSPALQHVALLLMLPVFPLLIATYLRGYIRTVLQHPMLIATLFWALAHLLANGGWADVLLFGAFLLWAIADWLSLRRRQSTESRSSTNVTSWHRNDLIAIFAGLLLYGLFIIDLHARFFGAWPIAALAR
ncbi:MAG TPA: NnrU family protein [Paenalcaligenes sp.]|nr:NnrU family protein [Paenalcaligenes sp.]